MVSLMNTTKHLMNINTSQTFPKIEEERVLPNSFFETSIILISKTKTLQKKRKKEIKLQSNNPHEQ